MKGKAGVEKYSDTGVNNTQFTPTLKHVLMLFIKLNSFKDYFLAQEDFRLKLYSKQILKIAIQVGFSPEDFYACCLQELTT